MKLIDLYSMEYLYGDNPNIFSLLADENEFPLVNDFINEENSIDIAEEYYIGYSAEKYISPLLQKIYDAFNEDENFMTNLSIDLSRKIYRRFAIKWKKIYDALLTEYKPLENYSMKEKRTPNLTSTENQSSKLETERETNASNKYKGFNSDAPVTINETNGTENVTTSGAKVDNETTRVDTGTEELERAGNIGVTTSQQMLESEFKVRQYDFYKMMYNDIDSILCLSIY